MRIHMTVVCVLIVLIHGSSTITSQEDDTSYVSWNPDGTLIAVMMDTRLDIVDTTTLEIVSSFFPIKSYSTEAIWNFDGTLIGFRNDTYFEIWENPANPALATNILNIDIGQANLRASSWKPSGDMIALGLGGYVEFRSASTGFLLSTYEASASPEDALIFDISWNSDGDKLAITRETGYVEVRDFSSSDKLLVIHQQAYIDAEGFLINPSAYSVDWSRNNEAIAYATRQDIQVVFFSDIPTGTPIIDPDFDSYIHRITGHTDEFLSVAWNPVANLLASGSKDGTVRIWDVDKGEQLFSVSLGEGVDVRSVAWSPDGTKLAYGTLPGSQNLVEIVDVDVLTESNLLDPIPDTK